MWLVVLCFGMRNFFCNVFFLAQLAWNGPKETPPTVGVTTADTCGQCREAKVPGAQRYRYFSETLTIALHSEGTHLRRPQVLWNAPKHEPVAIRVQEGLAAHCFRDAPCGHAVQCPRIHLDGRHAYCFRFEVIGKPAKLFMVAFKQTPSSTPRCRCGSVPAARGVLEPLLM